MSCSNCVCTVLMNLVCMLGVKLEHLSGLCWATCLKRVKKWVTVLSWPILVDTTPKHCSIHVPAMGVYVYMQVGATIQVNTLRLYTPVIKPTMMRLILQSIDELFLVLLHLWFSLLRRDLGGLIVAQPLYQEYVQHGYLKAQIHPLSTVESHLSEPQLSGCSHWNLKNEVSSLAY